MPAVAETVRAYVRLGEPVYGIWCPDCLLPSAVEMPVSLETVDGSTLQRPGRLALCLDNCHWITSGPVLDPATLGLSDSPCEYLGEEGDDAG